MNSWVSNLIEKIALRNSGVARFRFPEDLPKLNNIVVLWPKKPDDAAREILQELEEFLKGRINAIAGYNKEFPNISVKKVVLGENGEPRLLPAKNIVRKIGEFDCSIDLSEKFDLQLSSLPVRAKIPFRIGRDSQYAGRAYNIILQGDTVDSLAKIIKVKNT